MMLRAIEIDELEAACALNARAFAASDYGHNGEADLVRWLHEDGDVLVSLGAWDGDLLTGHILFSRMDVTADGARIPAAALAPIAVALDHRRQGIAAALISAGHDALRRQGISIAFVLGDPAYYTRFGYDIARAAPFASPYAGPHFMACALDSALSFPQRGHANHAAAFSRLA